MAKYRERLRANAQHLEKLRGPDGSSQPAALRVEWNAWREDHPEIRPDLVRAYLSNARLMGADLRESRLLGADLRGADLRGADLAKADLGGADLRGANLTGADLTGAHLDETDLRQATLIDAEVWGARLAGAVLTRADVSGADFAHAVIAETLLGELDLKHAKRLEQVVHAAPSTLGTDTLRLSLGAIPRRFLRGCGLSDWEIEAAKLHAPGLSTDELTDITYEIHRLRGGSPIQVNPLFISYSHADASFVESLEQRLNEKRIRYWRDVHDLKAGRLERQIERAIRHNPTVLLVISERSVESDWVRWEAQKARELEKEFGRDVLCPVALDDAWKTCSWPGPLRRQIEDYHILDFSKWQDQEAFSGQFQKLIDGLGLFYPRASGE